MKRAERGRGLREGKSDHNDGKVSHNGAVAGPGTTVPASSAVGWEVEVAEGDAPAAHHGGGGAVKWRRGIVTEYLAGERVVQVELHDGGVVLVEAGPPYRPVLRFLRHVDEVTAAAAGGGGVGASTLARYAAQEAEQQEWLRSFNTDRMNRGDEDDLDDLHDGNRGLHVWQDRQAAGGAGDNFKHKSVSDSESDTDDERTAHRRKPGAGAAASSCAAEAGTIEIAPDQGVVNGVVEGIRGLSGSAAVLAKIWFVVPGSQPVLFRRKIELHATSVVPVSGKGAVALPDGRFKLAVVPPLDSFGLVDWSRLQGDLMFQVLKQDPTSSSLEIMGQVVIGLSELLSASTGFRGAQQQRSEWLAITANKSSKPTCELSVSMQLLLPGVAAGPGTPTRAATEPAAAGGVVSGGAGGGRSFSETAPAARRAGMDRAGAAPSPIAMDSGHEEVMESKGGGHMEAGPRQSFAAVPASAGAAKPKPKRRGKPAPRTTQAINRQKFLDQVAAENARIAAKLAGMGAKTGISVAAGRPPAPKPQKSARSSESRQALAQRVASLREQVHDIQSSNALLRAQVGRVEAAARKAQRQLDTVSVLQPSGAIKAASAPAAAVRVGPSQSASKYAPAELRALQAQATELHQQYVEWLAVAAKDRAKVQAAVSDVAELEKEVQGAQATLGVAEKRQAWCTWRAAQPPNLAPGIGPVGFSAEEIDRHRTLDLVQQQVLDAKSEILVLKHKIKQFGSKSEAAAQAEQQMVDILQQKITKKKDKIRDAQEQLRA